MWEMVKLNDVCTIKTGKKDVNEGTTDGAFPFFTCAKEHTYSDSFSFDCEAILIAGNGAVGQTTYYEGKFEAYQRTYVLTDFHSILPSLLLLILQGKLMQHLSTMVLGNTIPYIKKGMLQNFEFLIPPLPLQQEIVKKLDEAFADIDKAISATEKNIENAEALLAKYISQIIHHDLEGYDNCKIGDICNGVEYGSSTKSLNEGKVPVIRMGNLAQGEINLNDLVYSDNEDEITKYSLSVGDVLFNRTNSPIHVGKTGIYRNTDPAIFAGYLIRIKYDKELVDPEFLNFYMNSVEIREYGFSVMSHSINQANINGTKLKEYPFKLIPIEDQKSLVTKIDRLKNQVANILFVYKNKIENLNALKSSILTQYLSGESSQDVA